MKTQSEELNELSNFLGDKIEKLNHVKNMEPKKTLEQFSEEILEECLSGTSVSNIMHMIDVYNADLIHFKNSSVGLWCIDKNPKEVSKEYIDRNCFQLS